MADSVEYPDLVIVGAGLFGLTVAQQAVEHTGARVRIIDIRDHIGGNAYSYFDEETGAEIHKYGAHLFHTNPSRTTRRPCGPRACRWCTRVRWTVTSVTSLAT